MRANLLAAVAILSIGCTAATDPAPKIGAKVVMPKYSPLFPTADDARKGIDSPDREIGTVYKGDLVEVLEVGEGIASVNVIRDFRGDPGKVHGFVKAWWK